MGNRFYNKLYNKHKYLVQRYYVCNPFRLQNFYLCAFSPLYSQYWHITFNTQIQAFTVYYLGQIVFLIYSVLGTDGKNLLQFLGQSNMSNAAANALMMQRLLGTGYELHPLGSRKDEDPFSQIKVGSNFFKIKFGLRRKIHSPRLSLD